MIITNPNTGCVYSSDGYWLPPIAQKQYEVFMDGHRFTLVSGPKFSGKTVGILHKVLKHAYDIPGARIGIFAKTTKTGKSGGPWQALTTTILQQWRSAGFGTSERFRVVQEPKVTGDTRQNMFKIRSRYGPASEVLLHSLEFAPEVEEKLKSTEYSMLWFSEIDQIAPDPDHRIVFTTAVDQLRMMNIPYEAHQLIFDCNPPEDGEDHWLHEVFFKEKDNPNHPDPAYQSQLHRIEFQISDNPFLDPRHVANLKNQYSYRQSLYDRFVLGKWVRDTTGGHFHEVFQPDIHVLGNAIGPESEQSCLLPTPAVTTLITGLDTGEANNAFVVAEKLETKTDTGKIITKFSVLDELMILKRPYDLRKFVDLMLEMILKWEKYCKDEYGRQIQWRHWSDTSAWSFKSAAEANEFLIVRNYSAGKIILQPAPKYRGSIKDRVKLLQQLLFEKRIFFSAQLAEIIMMLKVLRKGTSVADYAYPPRHTHAFDALTYLLQSEAPVDEIEFSDVKVDRAPSRLVMA